jgi:hypothetical protein
MMGIQTGHLERKLFCTLTDEEVQSRGSMLCETIWKIDETNSARSEAMKQYKERLVGLNESQRKLAHVIRERSEERIISCFAQYHTPSEGTKRIVREDTGEVVAEEPMTDAEKQLNLFASESDFEKYMEHQDIPEKPKGDDPDAPEQTK